MSTSTNHVSGFGKQFIDNFRLWHSYKQNWKYKQKEQDTKYFGIYFCALYTKISHDKLTAVNVLGNNASIN